MAPMLTERCRFTLNVVQDKIYAVGGASENVDDIAGTTEACACESYNPATGVKSTFVQSTVAELSMCVYINCTLYF